MAKITFLIRSKTTGQPATLYLRYSGGRGIDLWVPSSISINPEYWSNKGQAIKQRLLFSEAFTEQDKVNTEANLQKLRDFILKESNNLKGDKPTRGWLANAVKAFNTEPKPATDPETLNEYIERYIQEIKDGTKKTKRGQMQFSPATLKSYKSFQSMFIEYQAAKGNIDFEGINEGFYDAFTLYFSKDKKYSPNSIGKLIKILKIMMSEAKRKGLHNNIQFDNFQVTSIASKEVFLNEAELKRIYDLDLSGKKNYEAARDVFLIGCYTAQRYSDYSRLSTKNIKDTPSGKSIELIQRKTGRRILIPAKPELLSLLEKYGETPPKTWEQKVNKYIKEVGKLAKITELVEREVKKGGLTIKTMVPKSDCIKTHSARRSGCTNMYLAGIPTIDIMKFSGHKTESEFLKYIKADQDQVNQKYADHPYFIGNTLSIAK